MPSSSSSGFTSVELTINGLEGLEAAQMNRDEKGPSTRPHPATVQEASPQETIEALARSG